MTSSVHGQATPTDGARDQLLRDAVERARAGDFYAGHLAGHSLAGRADLGRLPVTTKAHMRDAGPFGMLAVPPSRAWHYHESSGTTGEPISTWCGLPELQKMAEIVGGMVPELHRDAILLNRFPLFAPVAFVFEETLRQAGACHIAAGNMTWDVPFDRALQFIQKLRATALSSLPLEPILLRELAREMGLDRKRDLGSLEVILLGGAVLPPALRRAIEEDWDARVAEIYGSNETMLMGVGCTAGRLHLCEELLEYELLDPDTLAPVAAGAPGVLTITSLVHEAMPLVRYVTGDLVRFDDDACTCGRPGRTAQVLGRFEEQITYGDRSTMAFELLDAVYEFADRLGTRLFFILLRQREVTVLVELDEPGSVPDRSHEKALADRVGIPISIEYVGPNEVLDRSAMFRTPSIYKPSVIADWRGEGRKPLTIMEALLEWPKFDRSTLGHLARRQIKNFRRRRRLDREDRYGGE